MFDILICRSRKKSSSRNNIYSHNIAYNELIHCVFGVRRNFFETGVVSIHYYGRSAPKILRVNVILYIEEVLKGRTKNDFLYFIEIVISMFEWKRTFDKEKKNATFSIIYNRSLETKWKLSILFGKLCISSS